MKTIKTEENGVLTVAVEGRVDTGTAPQLDLDLRAAMEETQNLVLDLQDMTYVSSAGLRVLLSAQRTMNQKGSMTIRNASPAVMEVFRVTGFEKILNIAQPV